MTKKPLLFIGILMLVIGIFIKNMTAFNVLGLILIITGVVLKTIYIVILGRSGLYKPGRELIVLAVGLILFLLGLYFKRTNPEQNFPFYLIVLGLSLKITFIVAFIKNVKHNRIQGAKWFLKSERPYRIASTLILLLQCPSTFAKPVRSYLNN